jgi:integrase
MTARRGAGEGSVYRRKSDGLWIASVDVGEAPNGTRRRKTVSAHTKRAALDKLKIALREIDAGIVTNEKITVAQLIDQWLDGHYGRRLKPATTASYRQLAADYVVPYLGDVRAAKLTVRQVQAWLDGLEDRGLSANTRRLARSVLCRALQVAIADEVIGRNVATLVPAPSVAGTRLDDALTGDEAQKVLEVAHGDRLEALVEVLLVLGLRRGEALALRWEGIDLKAKMLRVDGAFTRAGGKTHYSTPKTSSAARTIPLVGNLPAVLREHRRRQAEERLAAGELWSDGGWVFTSSIGTPIDPSNALGWWYRLTERAGIGRRRLHATRHTCATLMLDRGVPLELVSTVLGHSGLAITSDIYARPTADAKRRALEVLVGTLGAN